MRTPVVADWSRWHELLDIRDGRPFTLKEQAEYERFAKVVAKLDQGEAERCAPGVKTLVESHEKVLASIDRLTAAVWVVTRGEPMKNEPLNEDRALNIQLAKLCGFPVTQFEKTWPVQYPQVIVSSNAELIFLVNADGRNDYTVRWNPLADERQCFRYVVVALGRLGLSWNMESRDDCEFAAAHVFKIEPQRPTETVRVHDMLLGRSTSDRTELCKCLCLAALEAWEKLEKRDEQLHP